MSHRKWIKNYLRNSKASEMFMVKKENVKLGKFGKIVNG